MYFGSCSGRCGGVIGSCSDLIIIGGIDDDDDKDEGLVFVFTFKLYGENKRLFILDALLTVLFDEIVVAVGLA